MGFHQKVRIKKFWTPYFSQQSIGDFFCNCQEIIFVAYVKTLTGLHYSSLSNLLETQFQKPLTHKKNFLNAVVIIAVVSDFDLWWSSISFICHLFRVLEVNWSHTERDQIKFVTCLTQRSLISLNWLLYESDLFFSAHSRTVYRILCSIFSVQLDLERSIQWA